MIRHEKTPDPLQGNPRDSVWFGYDLYDEVTVLKSLFRFGLILTIFVAPVSDSNTEDSTSDSEDSLQFNAHILWLIPANHTSLNEMAHPQELVFIDECKEVNASTFIAVCRARKLEPREPEPEVNGDMFSFFYRYETHFELHRNAELALMVHRYIWLEEHASDDTFFEVDHFLMRAYQSTSQVICPSCGSNEKKAQDAIPRKSEFGVAVNGIEYHVYDTVYIVPYCANVPYIIGQIVVINSSHCYIRQLHRVARPNSKLEFYNDVSDSLPTFLI